MTGENPPARRPRPTFNYVSKARELYEELGNEIRSAYRMDDQESRSYPINRATEILEEDLEPNRLGVHTLEKALERWNPCESGDVRDLLDSEQPDQLRDAYVALESVERGHVRP